MRWTRGLVAVAGTAVATFLIFAIASAVGPTADNAQLARTPSTSDPSSAPETRLPPLPVPSASDSGTPSARPKPKKPLPTFDADAVAALKSALTRASKEQSERPSTRPADPSARQVSLDFVLSSFNVLGGSHTKPGDTRPGMAPGTTRIRWAASLLARRGVDVVGFQELQLEQQRAFLRATGSKYDLYPGFRAGGRGSNNSIAWRNDMWEMVDAGTVPIPYFGGNRWPMPVVLLRNRDTGLSAYFTNFHNPASTRRHPNQARWRARATSIEVALVNRLTYKTDYPVFLTGDLNERESAFCAMTGRTPLVAANGGSHDGSCRPPRSVGIDWIFGAGNVTFSRYVADRGRLVRRTTDHPMIVSHVRIEGAPAAR